MSSSREASSRHRQAARDHLAAAEQHQRAAEWHERNEGHDAPIIALQALEASKAAHTASTIACEAVGNHRIVATPQGG